MSTCLHTRGDLAQKHPPVRALPGSLLLLLLSACTHAPAAPPATHTPDVDVKVDDAQVLLKTGDCADRAVVIFSGSRQDVDALAQGNFGAQLWQRFILEQAAYPAASLCDRKIAVDPDAEASIVFAPKQDFWATFFRQEQGGLWGVTPPDSTHINLIAIEAPARKRRCTTQGLIADDDGPMPLCVDLPRGYDEARRYPVVWLLPGYSGDDYARLQDLQDSTDDAILVGVDSRHEHGTSYFEDTETSGRWLEKLQRARAHVDARYHTTGAHALLGKSTGGFNAVSLLLRDPEWACAAAFAPDGLDLERWLLKDGKVAPLWLAWSNLEATVGGPGQMTSYAHAWSSGSFPYSLETGELQDSFSSWRAHSPITMIPEDAAHLHHKLYLASAKHDEFDLYPPALAFHEALEARNIPHTWRALDAGHFTITTDQYREGLNYCVHLLNAKDE